MKGESPGTVQEMPEGGVCHPRDNSQKWAGDNTFRTSISKNKQNMIRANKMVCEKEDEMRNGGVPIGLGRVVIALSVCALFNHCVSLFITIKMKVTVEFYIYSNGEAERWWFSLFWHGTQHILIVSPVCLFATNSSIPGHSWYCARL
jgi:hypothetical protein